MVSAGVWVSENTGHSRRYPAGHYSATSNSSAHSRKSKFVESWARHSECGHRAICIYGRGNVSTGAVVANNGVGKEKKAELTSRLSGCLGELEERPSSLYRYYTEPPIIPNNSSIVAILTWLHIVASSDRHFRIMLIVMTKIVPRMSAILSCTILTCRLAPVDHIPHWSHFCNWRLTL